jgi:hypothetical protein
MNAPPPGRIVYTWALMTMWEITITCRDGSRLRFSELRGQAPRKGEIIETADAGKIIKARIDAYREEKQPGGSRPPFFQVVATEILSSIFTTVAALGPSAKIFCRALLPSAWVPRVDERRVSAPIASGWCPFAATIGAEHASLRCKGDVMTYDADSLIQVQDEAYLQQRRYATRAAHQQIIPRVEMLVGTWYVDEYGNQTREIKARD